jgi:predicted transcriptional regulator YdeE
MTTELINFRVVTLEPLKIIGKEIRCEYGHPNGNPIPLFWGKYHEDGTIKKLEEYPDRLYKNALVGWMGNWGSKTFSYVIGIIAKPNAQTSDNLFSIDIPKIRCMVSTIKGTEPDIYMKAHEITLKEMEKLNLKANEDISFEMEWYDERFCANTDYHIIDLYLSII